MPKRNLRYRYFTSLRISNVRCFGGEEVLDLTDDNGSPARWTLLLGENGCGKTTLLQCLEWMRPTLSDNPNRGQKKYQLVPALSAVDDNKVLEGLLRIGTNGGIHIEADMCRDGRLASPDGIKKGTPCRTEKVTTTAEIEYTKNRSLKHPEWRSNVKIDDPGEYLEPFIVAYGANRQIGEQNLTQYDMYDPIEPRRLSDKTELFDAEQILSNLDYAAARKGPSSLENKQLERFKKVLCDILPDPRIKTAKDVRVNPPNLLGEVPQPGSVSFRTDFGWVPMSALSMGYQTTAAWVIDFAFRLYREYPNHSNPLDGPAIALVDELCLHMHPRWQIEIIRDLSKLFGGTQFIATAHSPLMVQAAQYANLALIRKNADEKSVKIISDPAEVRGWRVDQILTSLFDVPFSRDPETEKQIARRDELLKKQRLTRTEQAELKDLQEYVASLPVGPNPDEGRERRDFIKEAMELLRKEKDVQG